MSQRLNEAGQELAVRLAALRRVSLTVFDAFLECGFGSGHGQTVVSGHSLQLLQREAHHLRVGRLPRLRRDGAHPAEPSGGQEVTGSEANIFNSSLGL
jgi:hypothetical protein